MWGGEFFKPAFLLMHDGCADLGGYECDLELEVISSNTQQFCGHVSRDHIEKVVPSAYLLVSGARIPS